MLHAVRIADVDVDLVDQTADPVLILRADAHEAHVIADRAVDRAGVNIEIAQCLRAGALARARGPVDGDGNEFAHVASSGDENSFAAADRPASLPVAQAICRLKPPV